MLNVHLRVDWSLAYYNLIKNSQELAACQDSYSDTTVVSIEIQIISYKITDDCCFSSTKVEILHSTHIKVVAPLVLSLTLNMFC